MSVGDTLGPSATATSRSILTNNDPEEVIMARWKLSFEERFWSKVNKSAPGGCWLWTGGRRTTGYGAFYSNGVMATAHRIAWELTNGKKIPDGLHALHSCDVKLCVRHIFLGTNTDNIADKVSKGRQSRTPGATGERHPSHKLSKADVLAVRASSLSHSAEAKRLKVSKSLISHIRARRNWPHVPAMVTADDSLTVVRG